MNAIEKGRETLKNDTCYFSDEAGEYCLTLDDAEITLEQTANAFAVEELEKALHCSDHINERSSMHRIEYLRRRIKELS